MEAPTISGIRINELVRLPVSSFVPLPSQTTAVGCYRIRNSNFVLCVSYFLRISSARAPSENKRDSNVVCYVIWNRFKYSHKILDEIQKTIISFEVFVYSVALSVLILTGYSLWYGFLSSCIFSTVFLYATVVINIAMML